MKMPRDDITGFVLAGGRSQRMGKDKAQIRWNSGTLLEHSIGILEKVASKVFVVGGVHAENPPAMVLADKYPDSGPLAGIHTALTHTNTDWNMVLAVDLPLVTPALLGLIVEDCCGNPSVAVVPKVGGRLQPLCAAYHCNLLPEIQNAIDEGRLSIHRLLEQRIAGIMSKNTGNIRVLEEDEMIAQGFRPEMLVNVNTPEDLERARGIANGLHV